MRVRVAHVRRGILNAHNVFQNEPNSTKFSEFIVITLPFFMLKFQPKRFTQKFVMGLNATPLIFSLFEFQPGFVPGIHNDMTKILSL